MLLRLNRAQDITMSRQTAPHAMTWEVGFDAGQPHPSAQGKPDQRRRVEPGPVRAEALARALCHIDDAYWIPDIEVHGRIGKTKQNFPGPRSASSASPQGMIVIEDILGSRCARSRG